MNKPILSKRSQEIIKLYKTNNEGESLVEAYLEEILEKNPHDIDAILRLAIVNANIPFCDYEQSEEILNTIFTLDPYHTKAWILLMHWRIFYPIYTDQEVNNFIHLKTNSSDEQAMIYFVISEYFYFKKSLNQEIEYLKKSIQTCNTLVHNHWHLASRFKQKNDLLQSKYHYEQALQNVIEVYDRAVDYSDPEEYLNEHVRGTHLSSINFGSIKKSLEEVNQKLKE